MRAPSRLTLRAPAKVNLFLEVRGRRPDGYHELRMFLAPVSLFDEVVLERLPGLGALSVSCEGDPLVPGGEENLCARAARFFREETGIEEGVQIRVRKSVPSGAGLGGGSSDAAATLLGLERLFGRTLGPKGRSRAAFRVGADVPFFFARRAAWVEGIGEIVLPAPAFGPVWMVLVYPGVPVSTKAVFQRFSRGLTSPGGAHTISRLNLAGFAEALRNDLGDVAAALEPAIGEAIGALRSSGAAGSLMSGSGSAVFGLFPNERRAREAAAAVGRSPEARGWRVEAVHTLLPDAFPFLE